MLYRHHRLTCVLRDGKKMSKSLQNYPDPNRMFDEYGADATRFASSSYMFESY